MAEEEKQEAPKESGKKKGGSIVGNLLIATVLLTVISGGFISVGMGYVAAVLVFGMLPGVSANLVDRRKGKYASKTVMAFNAAGLLPQMAAIFAGSNPNSIAKALFNDPMTWLWIYLFAAFGWLVIHLLPQITFLIISIKAEYSMKRIKSFQQMLLREWGDEITK